MTRILLVRHGRTTANASGILAGRSDVELDADGLLQAQDLGYRLAGVPLTVAVSSPMLRTRQTAEAILRGRSVDLEIEPDLAECDYGDWTGKPLAELAKDPLWTTVQRQPSAVVFPGGESLPESSARAVAAVRRIVRDAKQRAEVAARTAQEKARRKAEEKAARKAARAGSVKADAKAVRKVARKAGDKAADKAAVSASPPNVLLVSHGDIIKAILADALGMHLDAFQRIVVDPGSLSVIRYTTHQVFVERMNDVGGSLDVLRSAGGEEAVPGGPTGR